MKKGIIVPLLARTIIFLGLLTFGGYAIVEPLQVGAVSDTTTVSLTVTEEISLSAPAAISMSPNITMSVSTSTGGGAWNVKTNSEAGYTLSLHADQINALHDSSTGEAFTDCETTTPGTWNTVCENPDNYIFGFSAYGNDVDDGIWGSGNDCTSGFPDNNLNYRGFAGTSDIQIVSANSETGTSGTDSTMCVAATQGSNVYAPDGSYSTIITGTATVQ
ncbi:hypothetical protein DRZ78_01545 [Candidatus Aerophobetes bacterium]|uniref:Uncharacterized protein n=1 Tax=Aerophobetes bacterium TaxID=2030807 RepID=A0A662D3M9_UNCAE|nr:MAG: hypothetical protein DRZ78_01545 [Candidatus Aerophobetes bacterium]